MTRGLLLGCLCVSLLCGCGSMGAGRRALDAASAKAAILGLMQTDPKWFPDADIELFDSIKFVKKGTRGFAWGIFTIDLKSLTFHATVKMESGDRQYDGVFTAAPDGTWTAQPSETAGNE